MTHGYYPGCSLHSTAKEYDKSFRALCKKLDIDIEEIKDWICCGATPAHTESEELGIALPYQNLAQAEAEGRENIIAPCAACYNHLKQAAYHVEHEPGIRDRMTEITGMKSEKNIEVFSILEFLLKNNYLNEIREKITLPLKGIKIAPYYGCLLLRPSDIIQFDDAEDPTSMDTILSALGAESIDWSRKTECCGGSLVFPETSIVLEMGRKIFQAAANAGADCIAVACPLCQANLDMRQNAINKKFGTNFNIPVIYITQLAGLALGIPKAELGFDLLFTDPGSLLSKIKNNSLQETGLKETAGVI